MKILPAPVAWVMLPCLVEPLDLPPGTRIWDWRIDKGSCYALVEHSDLPMVYDDAKSIEIYSLTWSTVPPVPVWTKKPDSGSAA